ncbi:MAG: hypothetical protein EP318_21370 [Rhodobacteraceae bacterium]|nr:MAG: hypothetical protein EP318_21370 [Paracoccaceae bacterium]
MTLDFKPLASGAAHLPENYLPAALPALLGDPMDESYPLLPVPMQDARAVSFVTGAGLADPAHCAQAMQDAQPRYIGPPMGPQEAALGGVTFSRPETASDVRVKVLGLIDVGIAFWNAAFRDGSALAGPSCFKDMGYLGFSPGGQGPSGVQFLGEAALAGICQQADSDGHDRNIVARLGADFPQSVFGAHPVAGQLFHLDGFNHGTAIADLMLNPLVDGALAPGGQMEILPHSPIFGVELPQNVLLDASGETLQAVLSLAIGDLARRVFDWGCTHCPDKRLELRIVLPFAFTGSAMGGTHPVIENIRQLVANAETAGFDIKIFMPAGNHLQDQLHARPGDPGAGAWSAPLRWALVPDDHSANTVEITWQGASDVTLEIDGPPGRARIEMDHGDIALLLSGGRVIGAAWCRDQGAGWTRLRISLGQTASDRPDGLRVPSGDWSLRLKPESGACEALGAWILRDDRTRLDRRSPPTRQSQFRDSAYRRKEANGHWKKTDDAGCAVKRVGSISLLAEAQNADILAVGAHERLAGGLEPAWYGGISVRDGVPGQSETVDALRPSSGIRALVNGGPRRMRFSGTSAAAALAAVR